MGKISDAIIRRLGGLTFEDAWDLYKNEFPNLRKIKASCVYFVDSEDSHVRRIQEDHARQALSQKIGEKMMEGGLVSMLLQEEPLPVPVPVPTGDNVRAFRITGTVYAVDADTAPPAGMRPAPVRPGENLGGEKE